MKNNFDTALEKAKNGFELNRNDIVQLLSADTEDEKMRLFNLADQMRHNYVGDGVHLRGIIEFSNHCRQNCLYCGIRRENAKLERYRMKPEDIVKQAEMIASMGIKSIVLQSGEDLYYSTEDVADIICKIKEKADVAITLSVGERDFEEYKLWKEAGADRYLLKHETANREIFSRLDPDSDFDRRIEILNWLRQLGYQVGSGSMVGLPGQTVEDLADDILLLKKIRADMAGIGTFIPHPETPLKDSPAGDLDMTLKMVAVARIVLKFTHLPATTSIRSIAKDGLEKVLKAGANVVMPNLTPDNLKANYDIYPNRVKSSIDDVKQLIISLGRYVATDYGHSLF
jgi:biotin synthase